MGSFMDISLNKGGYTYTQKAVGSLSDVEKEKYLSLHLELLNNKVNTLSSAEIEKIKASADVVRNAPSPPVGKPNKNWWSWIPSLSISNVSSVSDIEQYESTNKPTNNRINELFQKIQQFQHAPSQASQPSSAQEFHNKLPELPEIIKNEAIVKVNKLLPASSKNNPKIIIQHAKDLGYLKEDDVEGATTYIAQLIETVTIIENNYETIYGGESNNENEQVSQNNYKQALGNIDAFKDFFDKHSLNNVFRHLITLSPAKLSDIPHLDTFIQCFFLQKDRHLLNSQGVLPNYPQSQEPLVRFLLESALYPAIRKGDKQLVLKLVEHGIHPNWNNDKTIKMPQDIKEFANVEDSFFKGILKLTPQERDNIKSYTVSFEEWARENINYT